MDLHCNQRLAPPIYTSDHVEEIPGNSNPTIHFIHSIKIEQPKSMSINNRKRRSTAQQFTLIKHILTFHFVIGLMSTIYRPYPGKKNLRTVTKRRECLTKNYVACSPSIFLSFMDTDTLLTPESWWSLIEYRSNISLFYSVCSPVSIKVINCCNVWISI